MSTASRYFPRIVQPNRFCRNGQVPEAAFLRNLTGGSNHIQSFRRKVFFTYGDMDNRGTSASTTNNKFRFRCHTGYAATHMTFVFLLGFNNDGGLGAPADPYVGIDVTISGGATTSAEVHHGMNSGGSITDSPETMTYRVVKVPVSSATTYEILITEVDFARVIACCAYEEASNIIDTSVDYYVDPVPVVGQPIYDATRQRVLQGLSQVWRRNGAQLITWPGGDGTAPTNATTTWKNIYDDGTGAVGAATPGAYLTGEELCRLSDGTVLDVVLSAYLSCTGSATGEVRLENAGGTLASITGAGTAAAWYTTTTTIADTDTIDKVDIQFRTSNAANTATLYAVSLFAYLA